MPEPVSVDFYFDVLCPYAWRTSLWMREVAQQRSVSVSWKQLSLALVNNADADGEFARKDLRLGRLFVAVQREGGNEAVNRLYLALGDVIHGQKLDPMDDAVVREALASAGLPTDLLEAALADPGTEEAYRSSHEAAVALGGFGVPTIVFDGAASGTFGPVVNPVPTGQAALDLWDHFRWSAQQPYFWEMKRQRPSEKLPPLRAPASLQAGAAASRP